MIATLKEVCEIASKTKTAVGSFNTPNSESLWAVIDAAEKLNVPVIIAHAQCHDSVAPLDKIAPLMVAAAKTAKVPVCVHLDHGEDFDYCKRAIAHGFNSIMIDYSTLSYEENVRGTKEVTNYAHEHNVDVEAELGALPQREGGGESAAKPEDLYTKPNLVPDYLTRTGIDALAIAFGTAHGIYKSKPILNMDIITEVRKFTDIPLVMHGGSGISHDEYREVIRRGINKINYYSYMAYAGYDAAKKTAEKTPADFFHNMALAAQKAMEENAYETLKVFSGKKK
ncbi:MAG: class II fructose-bisphosphate aldolase [Clostridiales bacterium]|nr:class II fructose-bisphosphate aldolase [Clostridiales bacterium]